MSIDIPRLEVGAPRERDDVPGVYVRAPYDEAFIDDLKDLPAAARSWDRQAGAWFVAESHQQQARDLMLHYWPEIYVIGEEGGDYLLNRSGEIHHQFGLFS